MKFSISNLGAIDHAEVELGDLTLVCGENNTGKTYVTYAIYGFLQYWHKDFQPRLPDALLVQFRDHGVADFSLEAFVNNPAEILAAACEEYRTKLPHVFATFPLRFKDTVCTAVVESAAGILEESFERLFRVGEVDVAVSKASGSLLLQAVVVSDSGKRFRIPPAISRRIIGDVIKEIVFSKTLPRPFIITAERSGAALFSGALSNGYIGQSKESISVEDADDDESISSSDRIADYPLPIKQNIEFADCHEFHIKRRLGFLAKEKHILLEFDELLGGSLALDEEGRLVYLPAATQVALFPEETSSSVKSLTDLGVYLTSVAKPNDLLIIDEPELSLHPKNQRRIARLLARIANAGIRLLITTHSDYIVKELNLLLLMHQDDERIRQIAEQERYHRSETLSVESIKVYVAQATLRETSADAQGSRGFSLINVPVTEERGIQIRSFDETIHDMNRVEDRLLYGEP